VGRLLLDFVHPEDRGVTSSMFEKLGQGRSVAHLVHRCLCSDDSYRWLIWNASPDLASGRIYACGRDHTDTRESEERLAQQLRLATLAAEVGVALTRHESLPVILRQCAEAIVRHLGAAFARIW